MAMSVQLEDDARVAVVHCLGTLGLAEAKLAAEALWKTADWSGEAVVWDFRAAHFDVSSSNVREIASFILEQQPGTPPLRVAFVAPSDAEFGMARMFQVFREDSRTEFNAFRDYDEAISWAGQLSPDVP